jgi:hypothetical protein
MDAGNPKAEYYLPGDPYNEVKVKEGWEPTSLLQYLQFIYAPLLMRISIPDEVFPPTHSISFVKFLHPKYPKEERKKVFFRNRNFILTYILLSND